MTARLLPITQNTSLVTYTIEVNGEPLPNHIPIFSIEVLQEVNRVPAAYIRLADGDAPTGEWSLSSEEYFIPGNEIDILAGYHNENELIFSGIIVSQALRVRNRRLELKVVCKDQTVALTTTKKSRHFSDVTDSEAAKEILEEYNIPSGHVTATDFIHTDLVQYDSLDWDFIISRMESNGLVCMADEEGFHVFEPTVDEEPVATLQFGTNVYEFDANIDARRQVGSMLTQAWNPTDQSVASGDGADPKWVTSGNLSSAELSEAVGATKQVLRHSGTLDPEELQAWSDAALLRSRMAFLRGRIRVQGLAAAKPGSVAELDGFGDRFNGPVWIGAIRHEIGSGNWLTDIEFGLPEENHARRFHSSALPAGGLLAAVSGLHTGVVTALEGDPAGESRIRVKIPSVNLEDEGLWARIATPDAGSSRGTFLLPEIDDEVLIGFLNDDPRHPVVLGMLHSSAHPPPEEASDDNHIKGYYSRSGMRILFDDDKTALKIDTPGGNEISLDDDAGEIALTDSNGNKIRMSSAGINISSAGKLTLKASSDIVAEGQTNVELKAGAQWKAEGSAGVEINSPGITIVKGSLVQIN